MPELERSLRDARPDEVEPPAGTEARLLAALGLAGRGVPARRWAVRRAGPRLLATAAVLFVAGGALAVALIAGSSGTAAPAGEAASLDFAPARVVARGAVYDSVGLAVGTDGSATVVYTSAGRVFAVRREPRGAFSAPERLSDPTIRAVEPQVVTDRGGRTTVVWRQRTAARRVTESFTLPDGTSGGQLSDFVGQRWAVVARTRATDGSWDPALQVSDEVATVRDIEEARVAVDPDGRVTVIWDQGGTVRAAQRDPGGVRFGAPYALGEPTGEAVDPRLAASSSGRLLAVWSERRGPVGSTGRTYQVRAAVADEGAAFEPAVDVGVPGVNPPYAVGAIGSDGRAVVAWTPASDPLSANPLTAALRTREEAWGEPERALRVPQVAFGFAPHAVVSGTGQVDVVAGSRAARHLPDAGWQPLTLPAAGRRGFVSAAAPDAAGGRLLAIGRLDPNRTYVVGYDAEGEETGRAFLQGVGLGLVLAAGVDGTAAAAWLRTTGTRSAVLVSVTEPRGEPQEWDRRRSARCLPRGARRRGAALSQLGGRRGRLERSRADTGRGTGRGPGRRRRRGPRHRRLGRGATRPLVAVGR